MNFDSQEPQPNMTLRLSASLMACVACFSILFMPKDIGDWVGYYLISVCLIAAGLYFWSAKDEADCNKGWKMSFFLGIGWLFNATLHLLMELAKQLPQG